MAKGLEDSVTQAAEPTRPAPDPEPTVPCFA